MSFVEVLARCLAAVEQGQTVEECLARFPVHAEQLAPLLRTAVDLRSTPPARLSAGAFARGRAAVAAQARYHQKLQASFHRPLPAVPLRQQPSVAPLPHPPLRVQPLLRAAKTFHRPTRVLVTLLVVLSLVTLTRVISGSPPGTPLYPLKTLGEATQGYLFALAGAEAQWHARQVARRLAELGQLARQGVAAEEQLLAAVDVHVDQALQASASLAPAEREQFLQTWLADLQNAALPADPTTVVTLGRVLATVQAASATPGAPTVLPEISTPTVTVAMTVALPTVTPSPELTNTVTITSTDFAQVPTPTLEALSLIHI